MAHNFIIEDGPDLVVDVLDASNPSAICTAIQTWRWGPCCSRLNGGRGKRRGLDIDRQIVGAGGVPVVPTVGKEHEDQELLQRCIDAIDGRCPYRRAP